MLAADGYVSGNIDPDQTYTSTITDGSGLQLVDMNTQGNFTAATVQDRLAWSNDPTVPANNALFAVLGRRPL